MSKCHMYLEKNNAIFIFRLKIYKLLKLRRAEKRYQNVNFESRKRHIWLFMRKNLKIVKHSSTKLRAKKEVSLVVWKFSLHNRKVRKREDFQTFS